MKPSSGASGRLFDVTLAAALFVVCEFEVLWQVHGDHGSNHWGALPAAVLVAGLTIPLFWRRSAPVVTGTIEMLSFTVLLTWGIPDVANVYSPLFALYIPAYSIATNGDRRIAAGGLCLILGIVSVGLALGASPFGAWLLVIGSCTGSWAAGRVLRSRRALAAALARTNEQLAADQIARERLSVAEQRTQIAAELQELVASNVSEMIVQAHALQLLVDADPSAAETAMTTLEDAGRAALTEMRRILGVLRRPDEPAVLTPQPGVGEIAALVERSRDRGHGGVTLTVIGDPAPLPASVDLSLYRIVDESLTSIHTESTCAVDVAITLRFSPVQIELEATCDADTALAWPTLQMCEAVDLCEGELEIAHGAGTIEHLRVRLPIAR